MDNPFYHRGAIRNQENFFGRGRETEQILGLLCKGQSVSLIGPRRIGKSSLLLQLCRPEVHKTWSVDQSKFVFAYIDCQEIGDSPAEDIYNWLVDAIFDHLPEESIALGSLQSLTGYRALDRLLNRLKRVGLQVVILLDEFELLAANEQLTPYFFARLRGLTTKYGLAYLTASQRPLFDITADEEILSSPFFNIFVSIPLGLFANGEAQLMWHTRLTGSDLLLNEIAWGRVVEMVGLHPFFLHVAGYHLWQVWHDMGEIQWERIANLVEGESSDHLNYMWQTLSLNEQRSLALLQGGRDTIRVLELLCLIEDPNQDGVLRYTSSFLSAFVRRQSVLDVEQFQEFVIDLQHRAVIINGRGYNLTVSQLNLLICLVRNGGQVVPASQLETAVWGEALIDDPDRLKTLIKRLRRAIEPYDSWIISGRGVGYALRAPA